MTRSELRLMFPWLFHRDEFFDIVNRGWVAFGFKASGDPFKQERVTRNPAFLTDSLDNIDDRLGDANYNRSIDHA